MCMSKLSMSNHVGVEVKSVWVYYAVNYVCGSHEFKENKEVLQILYDRGAAKFWNIQILKKKSSA